MIRFQFGGVNENVPIPINASHLHVLFASTAQPETEFVLKVIVFGDASEASRETIVINKLQKFKCKTFSGFCSDIFRSSQ